MREKKRKKREKRGGGAARGIGDKVGDIIFSHPTVA
jgi:hypothetical protein